MLQGLQVAQLRLSHEKYVDASEERVRALEAEVDGLLDGRQRSRSLLPATSGLGGSTEGGAKKSSWWPF
jgi:hypothetical protein